MSNMVYLTGNSNVYHTDSDCGTLAQATNPRTCPRDSIEGFRKQCKRCKGTVDDPGDYDTSLAKPGPKLDRGRVSPKDSEDNVRIGTIWTRDGFTQV